MEYDNLELDRRSLSTFYSSFSAGAEEVEDLINALTCEVDESVLLAQLIHKFDDLSHLAADYSITSLVALINTLNTYFKGMSTHGRAIAPHFQDVLLLFLDRLVIIARGMSGSLQLEQSVIAETLQALQKLMCGLDDETDDECMDASIAILTGEAKQKFSDTEQVDTHLQHEDLKDQEDVCQKPIKEDLAIFSKMSQLLDYRHPSWHKRSQFILALALQMNASAQNPIDKDQLTAAVFLHDIGRLQLTDELLHKTSCYTENEQAQIQQHCIAIHGLLISLGGWDVAATIILQHHEWINGCCDSTGIGTTDICDGAKVLAICHIFFHCLQQSPSSTANPINAAIDKIMMSSDIQFSSRWLKCFEEIIQCHLGGLNDSRDDFIDRIAIQEVEQGGALEGNSVVPINDTQAYAEVTLAMIDRDLSWFHMLSKMMDARNKHWHERTEFLLALALNMNAMLNNPVDTFQLKAAIYLHDVMMLQLPDNLLYKNGKYTPTEWRIIQQHPERAHSLLGGKAYWQGAAEIILQHHERANGEGYPQGLDDNRTCMGAKILAVCDAYYSMIHHRNDRRSKRAIIRAVAEINVCSNQQFSVQLASVFQKAIRMQPDCWKIRILSFLKASRYFIFAPNSALNRLIDIMQPVVYEKNAVILQEGVFNDRMYFLVSGKVGIYVENEHVMTLQRVGDMFGEMSIIANKPTSASVVALEKVKALSLLAMYFQNNCNNSTNLDVLLVRICSVILTDKLWLASRKAKQFEETNRELSKANQAKNAMLAAVSHEFRTPLTTIIGFSDNLYESCDQERPTIDRIRGAGKKLLRLVNDLLDAAKLESGKLSLEITAFDLPEMVNDTFDMLMDNANKKGVQLHQGFFGDTIDLLWGDGFRLQQVFINLIGNAIKFTEAGEISLKITNLGVDGAIQKLRFEFQDSGIGMNATAVQQLFKPFQQADSSITRRFGGTGLGLSIAQEIVHLMGGDIAVESTEGVGTRFYFELPFAALADAEVVEQIQVTQPIPRLSGQVLLADDTEDIRLLISQMIASTGAKVHSVCNGEEALNSVFSDDFDLIIMDVNMPVMDGIEAVKSMRGFNLDTPIIALTAGFSADHHEPLLEAGYSGFLAKPVQREEFFQSLQQHLPEGTAETQADEQDYTISEESYRVFQSMLSSLVGELKQVQQQEDWVRTREIVHAIKGSGGSFGHPEISQAAKAVELAFDNDQQNDLQIALEQLHDLIAMALTVITSTGKIYHD